MKKRIILFIAMTYSILPCLGDTYESQKIDSLIDNISWKSIISNFNYITTFDVRKQLKNSLVNNNPYIISKLLSNLCIPADTRSPIPVIPVHSVGNLQYMWQS